VGRRNDSQHAATIVGIFAVIIMLMKTGATTKWQGD
jgi:hypothetical protein